MFLFLDDVRNPPSAGWIVVRSGEELWQMILEVGLDAIDGISFDNDLGEGKWEGYQILDRIEELVVETKPRRVPRMWVHSRNTVAAQRMLTIIERIHQLPLL
jgi:hypothetical protein